MALNKEKYQFMDEAISIIYGCNKDIISINKFIYDVYLQNINNNTKYITQIKYLLDTYTYMTQYCNEIKK